MFFQIIFNKIDDAIPWDLIYSTKFESPKNCWNNMSLISIHKKINIVSALDLVSYQ